MAYSFNVTGKGKLPVDMLRHDRAWPRRGIDAEIMMKSIQDTKNQAFLIGLMSEMPPTRDRWASFGWTVS